MAILGPGSEWFWSMVSGIVLAVTFIAIYRQLRLQAGAGAVEQMHSIQQDWETELLARHRLAILVALRDGADPAKVPMGSASKVCDYWERLGYLVRAGHISPRLIHEYNGPAARHWWALLAPAVRATRLELAVPALFEHFEWLAGRMAEIDQGGGGPEIDQAYVMRHLPRFIEVEEDAVGAQGQARSGPRRTPRA